MKWNGESLVNVIAAKQSPGDPLVSYTERLLEAETAKDHSIPFTEAWYSIPVRAREVMIAARLGKQWLDSLQEEDAINRSKH